MGEAAELILDGIVCETCGSYIEDGEEPGHPRKCSDCKPKKKRKKRRKANGMSVAMQEREKLIPGDQVVMENCYEARKEPARVWKVRSEPWQLGHGEEVVLLEGKSGGFATRCLRKVTV